MNKNAKSVIISTIFLVICLLFLNKEPWIIGMLILFAIAVIFVVFPLVKKSLEITRHIMGEDEHGTLESVQAKVMSKSIYTPQGSLEKFNFVVFEKQNGERVELAIRQDEEYKIIFEGDEGVLTHMGRKYISFRR